MPIAYTCPHCRTRFSVENRYAGLTGPCAACGQTITISLFSGSSQQVPSRGPGMSAVIIGLAALVAVVVMFVLCVGVVSLGVPVFKASQQAATRQVSSDNIRVLALAMNNYHDTYRCFPPAVVTDGAGKPLFSGRVLLLPFAGEQAVYDAFDKTQAWNSPANAALTGQNVAIFVDPAGRNRRPGQTDFLFVTGQGTAFDPPYKPARLASIVDGTANTLMMVEVKGSGIGWAEPRDLDVSGPVSFPPGNHPNFNLVVFFDGRVGFIPTRIAPQVVRSLATCGGGEQIPSF